MGDFDRDGNPDFAVTNYTDRSVTVLYGMGKGAFGKIVNHDVGVGPVAIASGDIHGDRSWTW